MYEAEYLPGVFLERLYKHIRLRAALPNPAFVIIDYHGSQPPSSARKSTAPPRRHSPRHVFHTHRSKDGYQEEGMVSDRVPHPETPSCLPFSHSLPHSAGQSSMRCVQRGELLSFLLSSRAMPEGILVEVHCALLLGAQAHAPGCQCHYCRPRPSFYGEAVSQ